MTGALPVPPARRGRGADQQQEPRQRHARPAARASDPALAAARRAATARRWSASGTWAIRRPSGRCARATRSSSARCRAASTTSRHCDSQRHARPLVRRGGAAAQEGYLTDLLSRRAVDYVERMATQDAPFFLSLHYTAPHWPWETRDDAAMAPEVKDNLFHLARRQHPHLPPHDPSHGRRHRLDHGRAREARHGRQHAGGLHQRQRRRALLRQLAAGRRQDGPDRRRHPRAVDRALAGA